ncbi:pilus assembly protein [Butyrivibrio fibrisolvens]|uniref:TadE/TadG family type IV pilus assembly protein n=1 Tax=Pseudobutyrivibrio ruminis TaxID=46206 RepID=UPI000407FF23|nr:TadE family protein [Pseudobutyrivibrio ruminis]MDC7278945.1 pilus assembly protein [Butyrivibrio fibrisolvens]
MSLSNYKSFLNIKPSIQGQPFSHDTKSAMHQRNNKEMPFYASFKKASYTIEAAVVLPLFITLMVFGMFIFRMLQVQSGVQQSLDTASRRMAVTLGNMANEGESDNDIDPATQEPTLTGELSEAGLLIATITMAGYEVVEHKVPIEYIDGGAAGFDFSDSSVEGNYIDLKVSYDLTFPIGLLGNYTYEITQRSRCRKWVGYDKAEFSLDARYVYITDKGEAYHRNYMCTYLNPSVHKLSAEDIKTARNKSGGIYYQCHKCKDTKPGGFLYVTDYGAAWHSDINCKEIKHNIRKVLYEEVKNSMRPCSKCTGEK